LGVSADALPNGIERANRLRRRFGALERARAANGPWYERLGRAALWTDPSEWIDRVSMPEAPAAGTRILLAGSMRLDGRLHEAAEAAGASVVAEAHLLARGRLGAEVDTTDAPPVRSLARHLRATSIAPRAFFDRAEWIVERAEATRATAVVMWLTREDEALAWTAPLQRRALAAAGLPVLLLAARRSQADDDSVEQV